ncbi:MATE family efflux transporter [Halarchaeum nitratireducens]|uniref:MATE family efflux transporter n=1 Tax=Halarchaeum nitratireducens TaxID=489913 RepID=A0A830G7W3_9EURY|nr:MULTISPECIES: MATE family efflux transporter [Halarchaeum]MBP2250076.1 putative MATE family efflux protein [Halarchaeum solikamskense]GGN08641.1 MATE family efflux transporter [Halarchaeum nitratireducens]
MTGVRERIERLFKGPDAFDLTSGGIARPLFFLSLPIVITNLFQTAYNLADTFWLGQYSTDALAAISFAFPMVFLLISLGLGISVAGSVLVAQYTGAGADAEAEYAASQTVTFAVLASLLLGAVGYVFVDEFLAVMGASADVLPMATGYMEYISLGLFAMFGFAVFVSLMRGYGDTVTPMLVMFGSVVLNIVIDPFLIFGWGPFPALGIEGAAIATVFSRALAFAIGLAIMFRGTRGVRIRLRDMAPDFDYLRRLARIGVPASVEGTGRALSMNLLLLIVAFFPDTVVAGYGIGTRVFSVVFLPAIAVARGVETMTGQNIGAGEPERAARAAGLAAKTLFCVLTAVGVLAWVFAGPIVGVFTTDSAVVDAAATFVRYVALTFGFMGVMRAYTGSFRGAGETLTAAALSVVMLGFVRFPIAWVASGWVGETGIWIAFAVSNVLGALVAYAWYRRGGWRGGDLTRERVDVEEDALDGASTD